MRKLLPIVLLGAAAQLFGQAPPDFSKVEIKTTKLTPNFYVLEGQGGAIGVLTGPDGVFMVDSEFAPLSDKIVAAIKQVSNAPIKFLINTHVHGDHTGGDENFGKMGVTILAREELRNRLLHPAPGANGAPGVPMPATGLPVITYANPITIHMDGENIRAIPVPFAHTDGDTMVQFPVNNVIMIGDFFRSVGYPNIDRANGGSLKGMLDGLAAAVELCDSSTKVVPGHGAIVDRAGLLAHRDMIVAIANKVTVLIAQGKSADEVVAAHPTADFDAKVPTASTTSERFVRQLYAELKK